MRIKIGNDQSVFTITDKAPTAHLANCLKNVINVKALKGAFTVKVKTAGSFAAPMMVVQQLILFEHSLPRLSAFSSMPTMVMQSFSRAWSSGCIPCASFTPLAAPSSINIRTSEMFPNLHNIMV